MAVKKNMHQRKRVMYQERTRRGVEEREARIGAGQLREMDLGAPRGHILFPFEAPDKSNAAECIIH